MKTPLRTNQTIIFSREEHQNIRKRRQGCNDFINAQGWGGLHMLSTQPAEGLRTLYFSGCYTSSVEHMKAEPLHDETTRRGPL